MEETSNFHSALPLILLKTLPQTKTSASLKNKLFVQTNLPVQFNPEVVNNSIINGLSFFFSTISLDRITRASPAGSECTFWGLLCSFFRRLLMPLWLDSGVPDSFPGPHTSEQESSWSITSQGIYAHKMLLCIFFYQVQLRVQMLFFFLSKEKT